MARIPLQIAERRLETGNVVQYPQGGGPIGPALVGLGGALSELSGVVAQRQARKNGFADEVAARTYKANLEQQYAERVDQMPVDGEGFHDDFMQNVFMPETDRFLSTLKTPEARERYAAMLGVEGPEFTQWSTRAAAQERDRTYQWYTDELVTSQDSMATAISQYPDEYDSILERGFEEIEASGLPPVQKQERKKEWEKLARLSLLNRRLETDPEGVLLDLRADPRFLAPTTQFSLLKKAVIGQESGGDARAVSPKGAAGVMQVMPGTARDIAKEIGDENFNPSWDPEQVTRYLMNPVVNERYGDYYLRKMVKMFAGKGGLEAALIGYNGGPGRAQKWIDSGFDDSVIPKESADYYKAVLSKLPGMSRGSSDGSRQAMGGDPNAVQINFSDNYVRNAKRFGSDPTEGGLSPDLTGRVKQSFAQLGIANIKVTSGHRSRQHNDAAGGAAKSQHVAHNAMDIDVTGYSVEERKNIIRTLSANGITGIGVGTNIIHADLGGRRAWGYNTSAGGGDVPKPYRGVIAEHLAGRATNDGKGLPGRFAGLSYGDRQKYIAAAEQAVTQQYAVTSKATAAQQVQIKQLMTNELVSLEKTGASNGNVSDEDVSTILGEDDYLRFVDKREEALKVFTARQGLAEMSPIEMADRLEMYKPQPGTAEDAMEQRVYNKLEQEIRRVETLRARKPDEAAMEFPDVKQAMDEATRPNASPLAVQEFVRRMLERQADFNLKPGSEAPVPQRWAWEIGKTLSGRIPELQGKNRNEVNAAILTSYMALQETFGPYTEEVILHALKEYRAIGENTAQVLTAYMEAIDAGADPQKVIKVQRAVDRDQIESVTEEGAFSRGWRWTREFFGGTSERGVAPEGGEPEPTDEEVLRRQLRENE